MLLLVYFTKRNLLGCNFVDLVSVAIILSGILIQAKLCVLFLLFIYISLPSNSPRCVIYLNIQWIVMFSQDVFRLITRVLKSYFYVHVYIFPNKFCKSVLCNKQLLHSGRGTQVASEWFWSEKQSRISLYVWMSLSSATAVKQWPKFHTSVWVYDPQKSSG